MSVCLCLRLCTRPCLFLSLCPLSLLLALTLSLFPLQSSFVRLDFILRTVSQVRCPSFACMGLCVSFSCISVCTFSTNGNDRRARILSRHASNNKTCSDDVYDRMLRDVLENVLQAEMTPRVRNKVLGQSCATARASADQGRISFAAVTNV